MNLYNFETQKRCILYRPRTGLGTRSRQHRGIALTCEGRRHKGSRPTHRCHWQEEGKGRCHCGPSSRLPLPLCDIVGPAPMRFPDLAVPYISLGVGEEGRHCGPSSRLPFPHLAIIGFAVSASIAGPAPGCQRWGNQGFKYGCLLARGLSRPR